MPRLFLPGLITALALAAPEPSSATQGAAIAALSSASPPSLAAAVMPMTLDAAAATRICRMTLRNDAEVERAAVMLARMLPGGHWDTVQLAHLPSDIPREVRASVLAVVGADPVVYWRPPLNGAVLLHELVHAWQSTLPDSAFSQLTESLHIRDAHGGFDQDVVERATGSVVEGLSLALTDGPPAPVRELVERAAMADAGRPGALAGRGDALIRLMMGREWAGARLALARGLSGRPAIVATQRAWTTWVRIFFLLEAQAYDAQARCAAGDPSWLAGDRG